MENAKEIIISSFPEDVSLERIDKYIDQIKDSLKDTNKKFNNYTAYLIISIIFYHLYTFCGFNEINIIGIKLSNQVLVRKWLLVVPSILFTMQSSIGYLRVYQQESIEWLSAKYYYSEYKSGIYRLTFPSSFILGFDILRRQSSYKSELIAFIPSLLFAYGSAVLPNCYIVWAYFIAFRDLGVDWQLLASSLLSFILIIHGFCIIFRSQKI